MVLREKQDIQRAYQDEQRVADYIDTRFASPMARMQHERQVRFVRERLGAAGAGRVLEIAPGPARLTADLGGDYRGVALDFSFQMLETARGRLRESGRDAAWDLVRGDAFRLPFRSDRFDAVFSFRLIRHFHRPERSTLYREVLRVLRPGGTLLLDFENVRTWDPEARGTEERERKPAGFIFDALLGREEIEREMAEEGFEKVEVTGNVRRPRIQGQFDRKPGWGLRGARRMIVGALEHLPGGAPLEWLVCCRKG